MILIAMQFALILKMASKQFLLCLVILISRTIVQKSDATKQNVNTVKNPITGGHGGGSIDFDIDNKISQLITRNINKKCLSYR